MGVDLDDAEPGSHAGERPDHRQGGGVVAAQRQDLCPGVLGQDERQRPLGDGERRHGQRLPGVVAEARVESPPRGRELGVRQHLVLEQLRDAEHVPEVDQPRVARARQPPAVVLEQAGADGGRAQVGAALQSTTHVRRDPEEDGPGAARGLEVAPPAGLDLRVGRSAVEPALQRSLSFPSRRDQVHSAARGAEQERERVGRGHALSVSPRYPLRESTKSAKALSVPETCSSSQRCSQELTRMGSRPGLPRRSCSRDSSRMCSMNPSCSDLCLS